MKKRDLLKKMRAIANAHGVHLEDCGGTKHQKFRINGTNIAVPRHTEIKTYTAQEILKLTERAAKGG